MSMGITRLGPLLLDVVVGVTELTLLPDVVVDVEELLSLEIRLEVVAAPIATHKNISLSWITRKILARQHGLTGQHGFHSRQCRGASCWSPDECRLVPALATLYPRDVIRRVQVVINHVGDAGVPKRSTTGRSQRTLGWHKSPAACGP